MSENTKIEWCDHTFNAWEGCQKVGPGCDHCYAETRNARFAGGTAVNWGPGAPRRRTSACNWAKPKRWNEQAAEFELHYGRRQRVFTLSLGDWADNQVPIEWLVDLLELIRTTPRLDWLMLTKRIGVAVSRLQQAHAYVLEHWPAVDAQPLSWWLQEWIEEGNPPHNVWIGATITDQPEFDRDICKLLAVPAHVRFLSMEPLLGPVQFTSSGRIPADDEGPERIGYMVGQDDGKSSLWPTRRQAMERSGLHWVIVGGESGTNARPMHPHWARSLRDQCEAFGIPFLFKQWGEWGEPDSIERTGLAHNGWFEQDRLDGGVLRHEWPGPVKDGVELASLRPEVFRVGKKAAGRLLDGRSWDGFPS
jgi:protein gp37